MWVELVSFDIDASIFIGFLILNLIVGINHAKKIKTIQDFAIGDRNFTNSAIVATLIATWIGGGILFISLAKIYAEGITMIVAYLFIPVTFLIIGYIFVPRMQEFLGDLSVAESIGKIYGKKVELITAVTGVISCLGVVAIQFKIFGTLFGLFFPVNSTSALLVSSTVIIMYSTFGGIKSVTFTDIIQFITFSIFIPVLVFILVQDVNFDNLYNNIGNSHFTDFSKLFDYTHVGFYGFITLLFYFTFPNFAPELYQRILVAKNIHQVKETFFIAYFVCLAIVVMIIIVGILMYYINPNIESNKIINYILANYLTPGIKGLAVIGIIAMIMSTADSNINSSAILLTDSFRFFKTTSPELELVIARVFSILLGLIAIFLALSKTDLLSILLTTASFYFPIVNPPLMLAILGFRTTTKSVLIGMGAGFITVIIYLIFNVAMDAIIPAIIINFIFLIGSHYLLKQSGGWVGVKEPEPLNLIRAERKRKLAKLAHSIKNFNLLTFCINNSPKEEKTYSFFGIFCFVTTISTIYSINTDSMRQHVDVVFLIYKTMLVLSTGFMLYPMWSDRIKTKAVMGVMWNISLIYILTFCSTLFVLLSQFGKLQLIIFTLNVTVIFILANWKVAVGMIALGSICAINAYKYYMGVDSLNIILGNIYFHLAYVFLLLSTVLITLLKPKQEYLEATEEKVVYLEKEADYAKRELENVVQGLEFLENRFKDKEGKLKSKEIYLKDQLKLRNIEISKLKDLKDEFIRNIPHKTNTPMTGILSLSEVLYSCYDSLDEKIVKQSIKDIVSSSDRLKSFVSNIADLSKLSALTYELNKTKVDLSELVRERPVLYKKIFADDARQEFIFKVEDNIIVHCDEYYITQAIDNLISNAVKYGEGKPITISLTKTEDNNVQFRIADQGIGIPQDELISIFHKFTVSSKTRTPAGGRGIGLALCEKVITVHGGRIEANSDGKKGSSFSFVLPL